MTNLRYGDWELTVVEIQERYLLIPLRIQYRFQQNHY
jgi:hypothetical protein